MTKRVRVFFRSRYMVQNDCRLWARSIAADWQPDLVVFLAKSGFLFARPIADELDCSIVDISVSRPDNGEKDRVREKVPWVPRWVLALALSARSGYERHERESGRKVVRSPRFEALNLRSYLRILVVDDSVDTGWSMRRVLDLLAEEAPESEVRVASYCVIEASESRVHCDYRRFTNTIVMTATSRFSPEYRDFLKDLEDWKRGAT